MISYKKLLDLLYYKGIKKTEFAKDLGLSSSTLAKLSKNEVVSLEIINRACRYLKCQPGDILDYVED